MVLMADYTDHRLARDMVMGRKWEAIEAYEADQARIAARAQQ
jgi:hypothetical protein